MYPALPPHRMADKLHNTTKKNRCWLSQKDCRQRAARSITKYVDISLLFVFLVCVQQEQPVKVMLLLCRSAAALQFHRQSWSRLPSSLLPTASPCCGNVLWCTERAQLPKKKVHAENLNLVYMKPSAFKLLAVSPQVEEAIWFPCILSRKNFRYHLFFRGLKLTCVYLKTSACLANTNMQLWFSGTHYLTSWYVPRG